jgi:hypothetical protein
MAKPTAHCGAVSEEHKQSKVTKATMPYTLDMLSSKTGGFTKRVTQVRHAACELLALSKENAVKIKIQ